jgi:acetyltransferase-like isoleucine patch superfamily enzyme
MNYIGSNTSIHSGNVLQGSMVHIGDNSELLMYYLWNNIHIGNNTWIAGKTVNFGHMGHSYQE